MNIPRGAAAPQHGDVNAVPSPRPVRALLAAMAVAAAAAAQGPPPFVVTLKPTTVPAAGRQEAILTVPAFGYYALTATSSQGTALQLVDRMAGPGQVAGDPGSEDGRLDVFLDRGEYKVVSLGHEKASGTATLAVHPFAELNAPQPPALVELKPIAATLDDFQQVSYWLQVDAPRVVGIEAAGRNLADLRLWRDGTWLHEAMPEKEIIEPKRGQPLMACRLTVRLEAGLYLLTAYGGPGQPWSEKSEERPFLLRFGVPTLPEDGRQRLTVSPFGCDRYLVPGNATYFRLELPEARAAQLQVGEADADQPFSNPGSPSVIDKKSLPPVAEIELHSTSKSSRIITVRAEAGQPYILQEFYASHEYPFSGSGDYWLSTVHSGHPADSVDATVTVARWTPLGMDRTVFLDQTIEIDSKHGWARRCNLLDPLTVFLKVGSTGRYEVVWKGVDATARIEPFFTWRPRGYEPPKAKPSGGTWDLDPGFYVLSVFPEKRGILDIVVRPFGLVDFALELLGKNVSFEQTPLRASVMFPRVTLDSDHSYVVYINEQPGVRAGLVLRRLPLDLGQPLPVSQRPGEIVNTTFRTGERALVRARAEDGSLLELSVDGESRAKEFTVAPGDHAIAVFNAGLETVVYSLAAEPVRLQSGTPLPPIPPAVLASLPKFPILTAGAPAFLDLARDASTTFLVRAEKPALYRLETTGLLETEGTVRTRTVLSLDRQAGNGVGRNFLVQQFLREGDYQLTVRPKGLSAGHLGVRLEQTPITDGGALAPEIPARITLAEGRGVAYPFTIARRGQYRLRTLGLGHDFRCRLEDADGWPIEPPNIRADITREFEPGGYRLVLLPEGVTTRRVTLLAAIPERSRFSGHGPHPLPLAKEIEHLWEEPAEGGERVPDVWAFNLPATVDAQVTLSGEMQAELERQVDKGWEKTASLPPGRGWYGALAGGNYRLLVTCSRRNNQVGYALSVRPVQLVAGLSRDVSAPESLAVSVGRTGLVELSSFGSADVRAVLRDSKGRVLASSDDRPDDWNFDLATQLEPGTYALQVSPVAASAAECTVSMRALEEETEPPLVAPGSRDIEVGTAAHLLPLQLPAGTQFLVASVRSAEGVGCSVEYGEDGSWRPVATRVGRDVRMELPLAIPGTTAKVPPVRLRVWSADQRGLSARVTATAVTPPVVGEAALRAGVVLAPVTGSEPVVGAVVVGLDRPGLFRVDGDQTRTTSGPARPATASAGELVAATGSHLWLVADLRATERSSVHATRTAAETGESLTVRVAEGEQVVCDLGGEGPRTVLALVSSMTGQPGVAVADRAAARPAPASRLMAVGHHAAVAVAVGVRRAAATVWQAEPSPEPLEVSVRQVSYGQHQAQVAEWGLLNGALAERDSRAYQLPAGTKRLHLALGPGLVAVTSTGQDIESVHWAHDQALSEELETAATQLTLLPVGTGDHLFAVDVLPSPKAEMPLTLEADRPFESVETEFGTLRLAVPRLEAKSESPYTLHVRGGDALFLAPDGLIRRGRDLPAGSGGGALLVTHGPGRLLCWFDQPGGLAEALWGLLENLTASPVTPPATLALHGKAMMTRVKVGRPVMLHLLGATPVTTRLLRPEGPPEIEVHPNGCALDAYLPSGAADIGLRAVSRMDLTGTLRITATPLTQIEEGLGPEVLLPPGESRAFTFTTRSEGPVGVGVRADSDVVTCTLLDDAGRLIGSGVVQMKRLAPGTYVLVLHAPPQAGPIRARPAVVGLNPPDTGPPAEVIRKYLGLATGGPEQARPQPASARPRPTPQEEEPEEEPEGEEPDRSDGGGATRGGRP